MKKPKFRLWDSQKKKWYKYSDCLLELDGSITQIDVVNVYGGEKKYDFKSRKDLVIVQYTGLTDKDGKEICESDILEWDEKEWGGPFREVVKWDYEQFSSRKNDWPQFCEVIGNIYENPELIK